MSVTDQLFKKRRAKKATDLARKQAARNSYDKVLIACEGSKTEPNYLTGLINHYKLSTANVLIDGNCGSDPMSVVDRAEQSFRDINRQKGIDNYDRIFCVFDKDEHEEHGQKFSQSIHKIQRMDCEDVIFSAITSNPCFEVWVILHFELFTRPLAATGRNTAAQEVVNHLKQYIPEYEKGNKNLFSMIGDQTPRAISFAKKLNKQNDNSGSVNPSTQMHELVEYLQNLKAS